MTPETVLWLPYACMLELEHIHAHTRTRAHTRTHTRTTYELQETPLDAEWTSHRLRIRGFGLVCREKEGGGPSQPRPAPLAL